MARSRNIKPSFFTNDILCALSPLTRLLFAGLWCIADREGRLEDRPKKIQALILPYDNCNIDALLSSLDASGFIERYEVEKVKYIQILNFLKHQKPHVKEAPSLYPPKSTYLGRCKQRPRRVLAPEKVCTSPADSLNPLTDSLNPIFNVELETRRHEVKSNAILVLEFLNAKTHKNFRAVDVNLELIISRLKSGATVQQCKTLIMRKVHDWEGDEKMQKYLRPSTLFNKTKFEQYLGEILETEKSDEHL